MRRESRRPAIVEKLLRFRWWKLPFFLAGFFGFVLGVPYLFLRMIFGDHTHIQKFHGEDWKVVVNSGDGDPVFWYHADLELPKAGKTIRAVLGSGERIRYRSIPDEYGIVGIVENGNPLELSFIADASDGRYWPFGEPKAFVRDGESILDRLRRETGKNYVLKTKSEEM